MKFQERQAVRFLNWLLNEKKKPNFPMVVESYENLGKQYFNLSGRTIRNYVECLKRFGVIDIMQAGYKRQVFRIYLDKAKELIKTLPHG